MPVLSEATTKKRYFGTQEIIKSYKGSSLIWNKPVEANLLNLALDPQTSMADKLTVVSRNPLVVNSTGTNAVGRGGWAFQSVSGQLYRVTYDFSPGVAPISNNGSYVRVRNDNAFSTGGNLLVVVATAGPVGSATFTGNGGIMWVGFALNFRAAGAQTVNKFAVLPE